MDSRPERFFFDINPNKLDLEKLEEKHKELIERAEGELPLIKPALKDLVEHVLEDAPDRIVFLDKGARLFGIPLLRYLQQKATKLPQLLFYNPAALKGNMRAGFPDKDEFAEDFAELKDGKTFFVDETFSFGRDALALREIIDTLGLDAQYFALSQDPRPYQGIEKGQDDDPQFIEKRILVERAAREIFPDPRFHIAPIERDHLFTKVAARLYVVDHPESGETMPRFWHLPIEMKEEVEPFRETPEGFEHWSEYDHRARALNLQTLKALRNRIHETLLSLDQDEENQEKGRD